SARQLAGRSAAAAAAAEQTVAGRRIPGRHRVGLLSVGDGYQAGDGYTDSAADDQRGGTRTAAAEYTAQPTSNWFRPKRPSNPATRGAGDDAGNGSACGAQTGTGSGAQTWSAFGGNNWRAPGADAGAPSTGNSAPSGDSWTSSGSPWASAGTWGPAGWQAGEP